MRLSALALLLFAGCSEPILVSFDEPPIASIQSPLDATEIPEGGTVTFVGRVNDDGPPERVVVSWLDNGTGVLAENVVPDDDGLVSLTTAALTLGSHAITLRAVDPTNLSGEDSVSVTVVEVYETPAITIIVPGAGSRVDQDADLLFEATVSDPQDPPQDLFVDAESDLDGFLCGLDVATDGNATCLTSLPTVGTHRITFTVTDTDGNTAKRTASLRVDPVAQVPTVVIAQPQSGAVLRSGRPSQFTATVTDPQTAAFQLVAVVSSDAEGELCRPPVDGSGLTSCAKALTVLGTHLITVSATDLDGNTGTQSVLVTVSDGTDIDDDLDGFTEQQGDCDDSDRLTFPGAPETPNGEDDNCNGTRDEGTTLYDDDGDGFCESTTTPCTDGAAGGDCNDGSGSAYPGQPEVCGDGIDNNCLSGIDEDGAANCSTWWRDADNDNYGDPTVSGCSCSVPANSAFNDRDCDDATAAINPGIADAPDAIDNNCDGRRDEGTRKYDDDGDGYCEDTACTTQPNGTTALGNDCNDADGLVNPAAPEVCDDGVDNNCDTNKNEGENNPGCATFYRDQDGDTFGAGAGKCYCAGTGLYTAQNNTDCYDQNPLAFPGQQDWFTSARGDGSFDYNCASGNEPRYDGEYTCKCTIFLGPIPVVVDPFEPGWDNQPSCGQSGTWYTSCEYPVADLDGLGLCIPVGPASATTQSRVQSCH